MQLTRHEKGTRFVELAADGRVLTTRTGRIGHVGGATTESFRTAKACAASLARASEALVRGGWSVVDDTAPPCTPAAAFARNAQLEAAIRADRDDAGPYLVYADWLQAHGSLLGELVVLQHAGRTRPAKALVDQLRMPAPDLATAGWKWGLWEWLRLENSRDWMDSKFDALALARALFAAPMCAALAELRIGVLRGEHVGDAEAVIDEARQHAWAHDLARLHVGDVERGVDMAHHVIGDVGKRIAHAFPNLRVLRLHSGEQSWHERESFGVAGLDLPHLTELVVETCSLTAARCRAIARAKLPALERLELWFGSTNYRATATVDDVQPILAGTAFPRLTRLGLRNAEIADDLARALPGSPLAARLTSLDLSMGTLSDDGAAALVAGASSFPKLRALDVSESYLTRAARARLDKAFPAVTARAQKDIDPDDPAWRYVSVAE